MINPKAFKDLTGMTFGRLTVVRHSHQHKVDGSYWICKCSCSNAERIKPYKGSSMKGGKSLSCGCFRLDQIKRLSRKNSGTALWNKKYLAYKSNSNNRNRDFNLTLEQFIVLCKQPCDYCGRSNINIAESAWDTISYNGIDRVNNNLGYIIENCVSCCGPCNKLKGTMTRNAFLELVHLISNYRIDK